MDILHDIFETAIDRYHTDKNGFVFEFLILFMDEAQLGQIIEICAAANQQSDGKENQNDPQNGMKIFTRFANKVFQ